MKKLSFTMLLAVGIISMAFAQDSKIMVSAGAGMLAPACTNCTTLFGGELSGGYAFTEKIAASLNFGFYSKSESTSKIGTFSVGVSGEYYFKEAFKGFYVSPDITYITINQKNNGTEVFSENNITLGLNLGWAIGIGDRFRIIPHFGYGTWYENSKGRITAGLRVGFKI